VTDEQGSSSLLEVRLGEIQRFADSQTSPPQNYDQRPEAESVRVVARLAHDGDDLFNARRVNGIAATLVAGWAPAVEAGQRCGRARPSSGVEQDKCGHEQPPLRVGAKDQSARPRFARERLAGQSSDVRSSRKA
jgi:hypothetical protein